MSSDAMSDKLLSQSLQKRWRCLPLGEEGWGEGVVLSEEDAIGMSSDAMAGQTAIAVT